MKFFFGIEVCELALTTNRIIKWIGGIRGCGSSCIFPDSTSWPVPFILASSANPTFGLSFTVTGTSVVLK